MTAMIAHKAVTPLTFAFAPVGLNSAFLVALAWIYHRYSGHSYPHRPPAPPANAHKTSDPPPLARGHFEADDVDAALAQLRETYDIGRDDLEALLRIAEAHALSRRFNALTCAAIMSREVLCVKQDASIAFARETFRLRALWRAPVIDENGVVVGVLTPTALACDGKTAGACKSPALLVAPETPALELLEQLAGGETHEAIVVDAAHRPLGIVTQTDLLALALRVLQATP